MAATAAATMANVLTGESALGPAASGTGAAAFDAAASWLRLPEFFGDLLGFRAHVVAFEASCPPAAPPPPFLCRGRGGVLRRPSPKREKVRAPWGRLAPRHAVTTIG